MPTINTKRTFSFLAFLDNGETAEITYESQYISEFNMISKIKHVIYKNIDISPLFTSMDSYPDCICAAVENNEVSQWEQIREKEREDNFSRTRAYRELYKF